MLRNFIKKMIAARTASVAMQTLNFLTDEDLKGLGYTRDSYATDADRAAIIFLMKFLNIFESLVSLWPN